MDTEVAQRMDARNNVGMYLQPNVAITSSTADSGLRLGHASGGQPDSQRLGGDIGERRVHPERGQRVPVAERAGGPRLDLTRAQPDPCEAAGEWACPTESR